ncbi:MAG: hypothetical protein WD400_01460 [Pontimonas sp.]
MATSLRVDVAGVRPERRKAPHLISGFSGLQVTSPPVVRDVIWLSAFTR